jgi:acyl-CoA synthetase (AMP-forming)/AMP-acid ligase II
MDDTTRPNTDAVNVADHLAQAARTRPLRRAVVCPAGRDRYGRVAYAHLTFGQLDRESDAVAHGLRESGIGRGTRTILMVRPSIEFFVVVFALFKLGAVPVVVDPGMGIRRLLACYRSTRPQAFIGIPLAHAVRVLFGKHFKSVRTRVTVGRRWFWGGPTLRQLRSRTLPPFEPARTGPTSRPPSCSPPAAPARPKARSTPTATSTPSSNRSATTSTSTPMRSTCPPSRCLPSSTPRWGSRR